MLPGRQENSTEVDELQGVTLEEAGRVLTLECFLRGSRGKACCRGMGGGGASSRGREG